jgi:peroxiredoxin
VLSRYALASAVAVAAIAVAVTASARAATPWLGLELEPGGQGGVRVRRVMPESPAQRAGVTAGDEVLAVGDEPVATPAALVALVKRSAVGARLQLRVVDARGARRAIAITLEARPDDDLQRTSLLGRVAPDFEPAVQAGAKVGRVSSLKGQVVLIDFFATWCGPCVAAMPHINALHEKLGPKGLRVIGVSTEPPDIVARAAQRFGLKYTLASDEDEGVSRSYMIRALPTMVVIDRAGVVRTVSIADLDAVDAAVEAALRARP